MRRNDVIDEMSDEIVDEMDSIPVNDIDGNSYSGSDRYYDPSKYKQIVRPDSSDEYQGQAYEPPGRPIKDNTKNSTQSGSGVFIDPNTYVPPDTSKQDMEKSNSKIVILTILAVIFLCSGFILGSIICFVLISKERNSVTDEYGRSASGGGIGGGTILLIVAGVMLLFIIGGVWYFMVMGHRI